MPPESHVCSNLVPASTGLFVIRGGRALREQEAHGLTIHWPEELAPAPPVPLAVLELVSRGCSDPQTAADRLHEQGVAELSSTDVKAHLQTIRMFYGAASVSQAVDLAIDREDIAIERRKPSEPLRNHKAAEALIDLWIQGEPEEKIGTHIHRRHVGNLTTDIKDYFNTGFLPAIVRGVHEIGLRRGREWPRRSRTAVFALARPVEGHLTPGQTAALTARAQGKTNAVAAAEAHITINTLKTQLRRAFRCLDVGSAAHATTVSILTKDIQLDPQELPADLPTEAEVDIALYMASGVRDAAIARLLSKSEYFIETQRNQLATRLGLATPGAPTEHAAIIAAMWRTNLFIAAEFPAAQRESYELHNN
jgi:DNA-binding NarL/FixJ family response regulator